MNFYKHHLGDYDGATSHLSWDEDMAYSRLMRVYYRREAPIPDADRYRLVRATTKAQKEACDRVLVEFFIKNGEDWRNKRCDEEISAYQAQAETNKRIAANRSRTVTRNGNESLTVGLPNQIPDTRTKNQNQIFKPDLDVSMSPTRELENVKTVLKKIPSETDQTAVERNRRIANAVAENNIELAVKIREGTA